MQLMCDILVHDSKSSACLNDEQKSLLATFEHKGGNVILHKSSKRYDMRNRDGLGRCFQMFLSYRLSLDVSNKSNKLFVLVTDAVKC